MHDAAEILHELLELRRDMLAAERRHLAMASRRARARAESTRNFIHYLTLRSRDLRPLQDRLARAGLSSLGRSEAHVLATIDAVIDLLARVVDAPAPREASAGVPTFDGGRSLLEARAAELLGPERAGRSVRIMVTLSADDDRGTVRALLDRGMDVARINCAHDDPDVWARLVRSVRDASDAMRRECRVEMDLGGPKLRTGRVSEEIVLRKGDRLRLLRDDVVGHPASTDARGVVPAAIACSLPAALDALRPGEAVWFDDGKIGGVVEERTRDGVSIEITTARPKGSKLREDKGINFPDTDLAIAALTAIDRECLPFVARHADLVGLSFVQSETDVAEAEEELRRFDARAGLIMKIETKRGFAALPNIMLAALGGRPFGVMVARGDLAVECGYQRLAEAQEEILWLCEAAHVPAVWATQVLDRLARKGMPTRAEITDAAMSERAECVMLNKGEHVVEAVGVLDDILRRMSAHQHKKTPALRPLSVSRALVG